MILSILNIDTQWTNEDVERLFSTHGQVNSATVAIDAFTDKSRGFAQVDMPDEEAARKAMEALHNTVVNGRTVQVTELDVAPQRRGSYKVGNGAITTGRMRR